jgi:hypothetical protein
MGRLSYRERQRRKEESKRHHRLLDQAIHGIAADDLMQKYEEAVAQVLGRNVKLQYRHGRFYGAGTHPMRAKELEAATQALWASQHERELDTPPERELD